MKNKVLENIKKGFKFFFKHHLYIMPLLLIIDIASKLIMEAILLKHGTIVVIKNFFSFELVYNPGSFSGFLHSVPGGTLILMFVSLIGGSFAIYYFAKKFKTMALWTRIALYLIIPGAFGNMIDRFLTVIHVKEGVIDFFSFNLPLIGPFPVFNVADICLTIAMFIVIIGLIYEEIKNKKNDNHDDNKKIEDIYKDLENHE